MLCMQHVDAKPPAAQQWICILADLLMHNSKEGGVIETDVTAVAVIPNSLPF